MDGLMQFVSKVKDWLAQITEAGYVLLSFIVLLYILLGAESGSFVISVMANLLLLIAAVTPQVLVAVAIVVALIYLVQRKT